MRRKFHNNPVDNADGHFDSTNEWRRWAFLKDTERRGEIFNLQRQVVYELLPKQTKIIIKHLKTKDKEEIRQVAPAVTYTADFVYMKRSGEGYIKVVEDYKGYPNDRWPIKKALMYYMHGVEIREVKNPAEPI